MNLRTKAFFDLAASELDRAMKRYPKLSSLHEAAAVIREEWDELWDEAKKWRGELPGEMRANVLKKCVQIAAMAARTAEDLL